MKSIQILLLISALGAALPASADTLMLDFGNPTANTTVAESNTAASPGPVATGIYLTLSPGHATGDIPPGETTWNTITSSAPYGNLSYSNGNEATGVTLTMGQESPAGSNSIDFSLPISNLALIGNGGGTTGRQSFLTAGSIYGNSRLSSSAVGRDGFFGGTGSAIGFRVDGLAKGVYKIYLMGRNTNSNANTAQQTAYYVSTGPTSATFANFHTASTATQINPTYSTAEYTNQYGSFVEDQNHVVLTFTLAENESVFVAVDGAGSETRGFLNMAQITPASEPIPSLTWSAGDGDWDTTSLNWNADSAVYAEPAIVTFPTLVDEDDGIHTVNLTAAFSPSAVNISNSGNHVTSAYAFTGEGSITGETGITKSGSGIVTFSNPHNSYSGILNIYSGGLIKTVADNTTGEIVVANGATFVLQGGISTGSGQSLTLTGAGQTNQNYFFEGAANQRGALQSHFGDNIWEGDIILMGSPGTGGNTRIGVQAGATLTLTGTISEAVAGMSPYFRAGNSPSEAIILAGDCAWTGPTRIFSNGGIVTITAHETLPAGSSLIVGPTAATSGSPTFDLAGFHQTVAGLVGTGGSHPAVIMNTGAARSTLSLNPSAPCNYAGGIQDDVQVVIQGSAAQTFSGINTYTGGTRIQQDAELVIASTGELLFYPEQNGFANSVTGTGRLTFDGTLVFDPSGAQFMEGNSWNLLHRDTLQQVTYGPTFRVSGAWLGDLTETSEGSGVWQVAQDDLIWRFHQATGILSLVAPSSGDPYAEWIAANFPGTTDPAILGKQADPDGDGLTNLVEFALHGAPGRADGRGYHVLALEDTNGNDQKELTLTLAVRNAGGSPVFSGSPLQAVSDGVRYTIEGSLNLDFPASSVSEAAPATGPAGLPAGYEYRRFRLDASEGLGTRGFLRVKIEEAP